jgi:hypothetical protein
MEVEDLYKSTLDKFATYFKLKRDLCTIDYVANFIDTLIADYFNGRFDYKTLFDDAFWSELDLLYNTVSHLMLFKTPT